MSCETILQILSIAVVAAMGSAAVSNGDMIKLLREWELDHVFESTFKAKGYTAKTLMDATKEDIDEVFVDVDALHRRALFTRIQEHNEHSRRLEKVEDELEGYSGVRIIRDKAYILLGEKSQIKMYRGKNGNLKIVAPNIEFLTNSLKANGKLIAGGDDKSLEERVAALEKGGGSKPKPILTPCPTTFGIESIKAWNTGIKSHDVDLTKAYSQFNLDGSELMDGNAKTGFTIDANIFWYLGVELSSACKSAVITVDLTSNLHHLRTAYSQDGKAWTCASDYQDLGGTNRKFTGCKGGAAASYHGKPQMKFTTSAKYFALGFRDAGFVSALTIKCGNAIVTKAEHKFRDSDNKCQPCPKGYGCDGRVACPKHSYITFDGQCKACPAGNTCDGVGKKLCKPTIAVESVMAWNTGQKNHDVDLTKSWSQFTISGKVLRDKKSSTSLSIVSNYFWYIAVKLNEPCASAVFRFTQTSNLHHLRTAVSMDGVSWDCTSDYTDTGNNVKTFSGCKGSAASAYHANGQNIRFNKKGVYYAFGFRDAGLVSELEMTCNGKIVNAPAPRFVEENVCKDCPKGFVCDGAKKTPCGGTKFIDGSVCRDCPPGYTCADSSRTKCGQTFGFESVRGWNTNIKSHDVDLSKTFSQFTSDASELIDNDGNTGIDVVSNYFWWFAVKVSEECRNAVFSFTMSSSMHHLRTAYSQDGNSWTCASDYRDTGNNHKKFTGCKGGQAASYHGKGTGNEIRFSNAAQYYAFGYRDGGKATRITMTCEGKSVSIAQDRYVENNVCKLCPKGFSCASGKPVKVAISSVMAWNTGVKTPDYDLSKPFSQFTTQGAILLDKNTGTGIDVVSNYFWYIGVKLTAECPNAIFSFTMTSSMHHLRTAYSQDGITWTCASDYLDTGNNAKKFVGCKGGQAAAYHGKGTGNKIRFTASAQYYAFGFRDGGKVSEMSVTCDGRTLAKA